MSLVTITVTNWAKYNPRQDRTNYTWLRFENTFFTDQKLFGLTDSQVVLLLMILCEASKKSSACVEMNIDYIASLRKTTRSKIVEDIQALASRDVIVTAVCRQIDGNPPQNDGLRTNERTNETNERTVLAVGVKPPPPDRASNPVKFYCDLWKARNGKSPDIRGKEAGQLTKLVKDLGWERAQAIMRAYFAMPDPFFIKRGYDVTTMLANLAAIAQFEASGKVVTKQVVEQIEKQVDKIQGTKKRRSIAEIEAEQEAMRTNGQLALGGRNGNQA